MKVLHLFNEYLPFSEIWAYNLLCEMENTDVVIGAFYYNDQFKNEAFEFIPRKRSSEISELLNNPATNIFRRINNKRRFSKLKADFQEIQNWITVNRPDLIHFHFGTTAVKFERIWNNSINIPFVVSFYGYDYEKAIYDHPKLKEEYKMLFEKVSSVFVEGTNGVDLLSILGLNRSKIKVLRLGVDTENIVFQKRKISRPLKFIQIANFLEKKGQVFIVEAVNQMQDIWKDKIHITLIGNHSSEYGTKVLDLIQEYNINSFFTIKGIIPYQEIQKELRNNHVFIHPSCYAKDMDCEGGAPTILLDAQASGMPIVSTLHCDIPSYVQHGNTGFLTPEKDVNGIIESINKFLEMDNSEYVEMCKSSRAHIEKDYNVKQNARLIEQEYANFTAAKYE
ncbi:glycosyltransferase [Portibacter lacus]|uniref:Glycosyl transferase family 1 domain-containing protein n=1 Tax=Portibacter lacus TaxID=1099794 RepID=A0AA37WFV0_9BACT|nr:glycosyltransferase [Portibacter lacus]GLR19017.1 hypothetical protein GCM10007940_36330 [Portibacter lacus]